MSESGDYSYGSWSGYDFKDARREYDRHAGRSYSDATTSQVKGSDLVPNKLETKSDAPLVIVCDVTASMGDWPSVIFSKLPYLENEGKEYLGKGMEISFAAVGDANSDKYPLQVRPFVSGRNLESELKKLIIEKKGGRGIQESYDLAALYYANNVSMPNATKPLIIFIGDEAIYETVDKIQARDKAYTKIEAGVKTSDVFEDLKRKYSVYLVRKPYDLNDQNSSNDRVIRKQWESYIGKDHIALLSDPSRVVDVTFGIMAKETSRIDYFKNELKDRQKPEQVEVVLNSLHTMHNEVKEENLEGRSLTHSKMGGKKIRELT